ncbi:pimeloyl-ACP methyl ester carboxylesterase [Lentzea atacamensis]|uniref:Pimeloyl-ACP methyl ester carboxylesterase n=1 Tax=Lentzea atacamensis TaxID=531938 RepID=A0ABX9E7P3_9PSEU|nr:alpha/beta fold hydrolase [Lentzea atacamensis]RAS65698.1 pimeloyl-ACP methyl ester carboxylesterase [Lentzea atacamensis]
MGTFSTYDGTKLAYHGPSGPDPLICLPGGPMQASSYLAGLPLGDVLRLDLRGTGDSEEAPKETYRADRQVDDVEAFRQHLGLDKLRLLGHSAGGTLAILYAARFPQHVKEIVLVAPSPRVVGIDVTDEDRREVALRRSGEPWYPEAIKAFEEIWAGNMTPEAFKRIGPFWYGRYDDAARELEDHPTNDEGAREFYAEGALDPDVTRAALETLDVPALLIAGEVDVALPPKRAQEYADLFPRARLVVQPGAGHFPWVDDPEAFAATVQRIP